MPTLYWLNDEEARKQSGRLPYRLLEADPKLSSGDSETENILIQGDNLLPTSSDYFYPDFVALLNNGRILVVEYKGKPYETNDDSKEKMNIGELWESKSKGKGLFLMAVKRDVKGRDVYKQIEDKIRGKY